MDSVLDAQALKAGIGHLQVDIHCLQIDLSHRLKLEYLFKHSIVLVKLTTYVLQQQFVQVFQFYQFSLAHRGRVVAQVFVSSTKFIVVQLSQDLMQVCHLVIGTNCLRQ